MDGIIETIKSDTYDKKREEIKHKLEASTYWGIYVNRKYYTIIINGCKFTGWSESFLSSIPKNYYIFGAFDKDSPIRETVDNMVNQMYKNENFSNLIIPFINSLAVCSESEYSPLDFDLLTDDILIEIEYSRRQENLIECEICNAVKEWSNEHDYIDENSNSRYCNTCQEDPCRCSDPF